MEGRLQVFTGSANPSLAGEIAEISGHPAWARLRRHIQRRRDAVRIEDNVRGR